MHKPEEINDFFDRHKPITWGLLLSTIIFKFAMANIVLGVAGAIFLFQVFLRKKIIFDKSLLSMAFFVLWGIASLLWTTHLPTTLQGVSASLPLLIIPVLISQYSDFKMEDFSKSVRVFSYFLLGYFVVSLANAGIHYLEDKRFAHFFYHDLVSIFKNNAIYISLAVATCILMTANFSKKTKADYWVMAFLGLFLLLLSSKNIITTTLLLLALTMLIRKRNFKKIMAIAAGLAVIIALLALTDNPIRERFLSELHINLQHVWTGQDFYAYKFSGFEIRFFQWRIMAEMIQNHQVGLTGLGLHNVDYLLDQYFSYYNLYKGYFYINFHNQYLQTLGELGFVGLLLLLIVFGHSIYRAFVYRNTFELFFIVLFMAAFFTESFLARQKGVFLFATVYSLISKFPYNRPVSKT